MSTLISQLPEEIKLLAIKRQKECKDKDFSKRTDELFQAFDWSKSSEGWYYWSKVCRDFYPKPVEHDLRTKLASIIDRRLSRNETIDLLVKLWEEGK